MSIYTDCSRTAKALSKKAKVFTEIDVVQSAAKQGWGETQFKDALREANQICSTSFREGRLVRFGPVTYQGQKDYARIASKIVYAGVENGPKVWETPNGNFKQLKAVKDPVGARPGRRAGTERDDSKAWSEQEVSVAPPQQDKASAKQALADEVVALRRESEAKDARIAELQAQLAEPHTNGNGVVALPGELSEEMIRQIAKAVMPDLQVAVTQEVKDKLAEAFMG